MDDKERRRIKFHGEHPKWYSFTESKNEKKLREARERYLERLGKFHSKKAARVLLMYKMHEEGKTLREIGDHFGITHERVRQLLA